MERITVIGAGTMGSGIAQLALQHGATVTLYDADAEKLRRGGDRVAAGLALLVDRGRLPSEEREAALGRLQTSTDLEGLGRSREAELLIEATPENMALKRGLFAVMDRAAPPEAILASNTAGLSITALAAAVSRPERVIGMHFFNPVHSLKLVEVVPGLLTSPETIARATEQATAWGKTPLRVKNQPGFIVNRVSRALGDEAIRLLDEGVASVEAIDGIARAMGFRAGPFAQMDSIGLDVVLSLSEAMYAATYGEPRYRPHPLQAEMVDAGWLGRKAGKGFHEYGAE